MYKNRDPFQILGLSDKISISDLEKAYSQLEFKFHPDNFTTQKEKKEAEEKLFDIDWAYNEAKKIIKDKPVRENIFSKITKTVEPEIKPDKEESSVFGNAEIVKKSICSGIRKKFYIFGEKYPQGSKDEFSTSVDEEVYLYLKIKNIDRKVVDVRIEWISPYGEVFQYIANRFEQFSSSFIFYCWLDLFGVEKNKIYGIWKSKIYFNTVEMSEMSFKIKG